MKKATALTIILAGGIVTIVVLSITNPGMVGSALTGVLGGAGEQLLAFVQGVQTHPVSQQYGLPIGLAAGLGVAAAIHKAWPVIRHRQATPPKQYHGPPPYTPGTVINSDQPQQVPQQPIPQKVEQK